MRARRRATAYEKLKKYDEAEKDVKVALEIDSTDKAIIQVMPTREAELRPVGVCFGCALAVAAA